jgi:hypothetical protein
MRLRPMDPSRKPLTLPNQVRLQTQPHDASRKNMMQMVSHVVKSDGFTGLYRGVRGYTLRIAHPDDGR